MFIATFSVITLLEISTHPSTLALGDDAPLANRHMNRRSTLLIIREMQTKTTIRYHLTPVRMVIIKKSTNKKCWRGVEKREP